MKKALFYISGKIICVIVALMVSFLIIKSHLVDTNSDVAVIWGYKPNTTFDFFIYFLVYAICCFLSIFLFGSKYKFIDIIVYLV